ncbi:unnamed protein product, partial [Closterium sp. NIES-65]
MSCCLYLVGAGRWEGSGYFKPDESALQSGAAAAAAAAAGSNGGDKADSHTAPFVISMPPPNVTGALHMGHAMFVTLEDIMTRFWRMKGRPTLWLPGTDHAGIATQLVVEKMLASEGISRQELGREEFVKRVWEWKEKYGGTIAKQIRRLGASCDWSRERFTLDDQLSKAVVEAFVRLHNKGLIYRGTYMVNWSPFLQTAVSDLEVEYSEEPGTLYFFKYPIAGGTEDDYLPVATTRPETILGDTAVAVHPEDERFKKFVGKQAVVPLCGGRTIPIIADDYVDMEFGTGCLRITPGHAINDNTMTPLHCTIIPSFPCSPVPLSLSLSLSPLRPQYVDMEFGTGCLKSTPGHDINDCAIPSELPSSIPLLPHDPSPHPFPPLLPPLRPQYVDMEFGTGCLKSTPGHDINDCAIPSELPSSIPLLPHDPSPHPFPPLLPPLRPQYVDMEFGTGCLKSTPGHDINDCAIPSELPSSIPLLPHDPSPHPFPPLLPPLRPQYVDMEFGTGCLKSTPGHDINDCAIPSELPSSIPLLPHDPSPHPFPPLLPPLRPQYVDMEFGTGCLKSTPGHDINDCAIPSELPSSIPLLPHDPSPHPFPPLPPLRPQYVDMEFGTGCLKITPGHDINDYAIGQRRDLPIINILNKDATLNENAGAFCGLDRFEARKQVWEQLEKEGLAIKQQPHVQRVPRSQRGGEVVEPLVSRQWFVRMQPLAEPALEAARTGELKIIPERFEKV